jgi:RNA polymerase sigma factor (sigma-70 family)
VTELDAQFADFVRMHTAGLLRTATMLTGSAQPAEELVPHTFAHLNPSWSKVATASSASAYVRRSLVNRHLGRQRQVRAIAARHQLSDEQDQRPAFTDQVADRDQLRQLLADLAPRQRTAIVLRYFDDLDDAAIAEAMNCRVGTVRSLISRALATLRHAQSAREKQIS